MYGAYTPKMPDVTVLAVSPTSSTSLIGSFGATQVSSQITYLITYYYVGINNATLYQSKLVNQIFTAIKDGKYSDLLDGYVAASGKASSLTTAAVSPAIKVTPPQILSRSPTALPIAVSQSSSSSNENSAGTAAGIAIGVIFAVFAGTAAFLYYRHYLATSSDSKYNEYDENADGNNNVTNNGSMPSKYDFNYPTSSPEGNTFDNNQYIEKAATFAPNVVQMPSSTNGPNNGLATALEDGDVNFKPYDSYKSNEPLATGNQENPMRPPSLGAFLEGDDGGVVVEANFTPKAGAFRTSLAAFFD